MVFPADSTERKADGDMLNHQKTEECVREVTLDNFESVLDVGP